MKIFESYNTSKLAIYVVLIMLFFTSCIVQSPKYSTLGQVMTLQLGMSKAQVEDTLGVQPYDLKSKTDTSTVYIYIYRVTDRRTLYLITGRVNGKKSMGKYVQLFVGYSKDDKVISIESCSTCADNLVTHSNFDFEKLFVFVTVTLPILLLFLKVGHF